MTAVGGQPKKKTITASYKETKHYESTFVISDYYWLYLSSHLPPRNIMLELVTLCQNHAVTNIISLLFLIVLSSLWFALSPYHH